MKDISIYIKKIKIKKIKIKKEEYIRKQIESQRLYTPSINYAIEVLNRKSNCGKQ